MKMKYLPILVSSIHIIFYQNQFINEYVRKKKKSVTEKCDIRKSSIVTFNDLRGHTLFYEKFASL